MEFETEIFTDQALKEASKLPNLEKKALRFLITSGVLSGCVLSASYITQYQICFSNPFTNKCIYPSLENIKLVKNYTDTYIPETIEKRYKTALQSQTEGIDKFGGTVYVDSIVAYIDKGKSADESLRVGVVTHISKVGVVTVRDIAENTEQKLPTSRRHFVIDENIFDRLMILKLTTKS